ncbi:MAG: radical SAM protein [Theionarchaea archaeon]|nr:radical SAM protein [Theionarchaea archaeon]
MVVRSLLYFSQYFNKLLGVIPIHPYAAKIKITENCNGHCITCNTWKTKHTNELSTEELQNIMNQMRDVGIRVIKFTGGEPLLREDATLLIKEARNLGFKEVAIQTNGLLLCNRAEELVKSGITDISISVDGIGKTNNIIRGIPYAYDASLLGIKAITLLAKTLKKKINVRISTTLTKYSIEEVPMLLEVCRDLGISFRINLLDKNPYEFRGVEMSALSIDNKQVVDKTLDHIETMKKETPWIISEDSNALEYVRAYCKGTPKEFLCAHGYLSVYLSSRGEVYSGCWVLNPIGNLRKTKLRNILRSDEYKRRAQQMFVKKCPGCTCGYALNVYVANFLFPTNILGFQL